MGSAGALVQAHPRISLSVVISKFPSTGQTNPLEKLDLRSPNMALQTHPGEVFSLETQVRPLLSFSRKRFPLTHPTGGPGGSGLEFIFGFGRLLNNLTGGYYDIVSWDPRGVGSTT